jgi:hypothetical protein
MIATSTGQAYWLLPTWSGRTRFPPRSFDTPKLPSAETFYFVVRPRDRAGNEDSNTSSAKA